MDLKTYTTHLRKLQSTSTFLKTIGPESVATRLSLIDLANESAKHLEIGMKIDGYTPSIDLDCFIAAVKGTAQTILPDVADGQPGAWKWHLATLCAFTKYLIKDVEQIDKQTEKRNTQ